MWYYKDAGRVHGPYRTEDICAFLSQGIIQRGTLVAREGEGTWTSLDMVPEFSTMRAGSFHGVNPHVVATLGSAHVKSQYREHLNAIIHAQRLLIIAYVALMAFNAAGMLMLVLLDGVPQTAAAVAINVVSSAVLGISMARLAGAMQIPQWPWVVAAFLPCWWLIAVVLLIQRASNVLTQTGVQVGLLGAKQIS